MTASFLKELLRRAALLAADGAQGALAGVPAADPQASARPQPGSSLVITDAELGTALDQLLDASNQLTRALLGGTSQDP